jgi:hypothetical protein
MSVQRITERIASFKASEFACYLREKFEIERMTQGLGGDYYRVFRDLSECASNSALSRTS